MFKRGFVLLAVLAAAGCASGTTGETAGDAAREEDGGPADLRVREAAGTDLTLERTAGEDTVPEDAGPADTGPTDAGPTDTGPTDIPSTDATSEELPLEDAAEDVFLEDAAEDTAADVLPDTPPSPPPCQGEWVDGRLVHGSAPPLAMIDPGCGRVSYGWYAVEGETEANHLLPDFSFAGYMGGGVPIPAVPVVQTLSPGGGDDHAEIQAALDAVSALPLNPDGFRGAVLLAAGTWQVGEPLTIAASGVVLRGEGQGSGGTLLVATKPAQHELIHLKGSGAGFGEVPDSRVEIVTPYVPVGARTFVVADAQGFAPGDLVGVLRTPNQAWINALDMGQWGWTPDSYEIAQQRRVVAVDGDAVTVDPPLTDSIKAEHGGGALFLAESTGCVERVGVEDLRLVSEYASETDEDHGWVAVKLSKARNCWVRRVTAQHFGYAAVSVHDDSSHNTFEEVAQLDPISQVTGGRRYSFNVSSGTGNLFQRCYARDGRHNFVTGSRVAGPNVWLDSLSMANNSDEGPHHRWSTGLLFDNCMSGVFNVQNRKDSGSGHGWAGAQTLFWNIFAFDAIRCDAPHGAMNWAVGCIGEKTQGSWAPEEPFGIWESEGEPVVPRSLYLAQLEDRLGPDAVAAVATPAQVAGALPQVLNSWAGKGLLPAEASPQPSNCPGIASASGTCCPASCGVCGGKGCGSLPGGVSNCCNGAIEDAGKPCSSNPPPCVMDEDGEGMGVPIEDFHLVFYWMVFEADYLGPPEVALEDHAGAVLAVVSQDFANKIKMEGTGELLDGRILNLQDECPDAPTGWCYFEVDTALAPYGLGSEGPLEPFRSVALVEGHYLLGKPLYAPALDGLPLPSSDYIGAIHDGCLVASDTGWSLDPNQMDFYVHHKDYYFPLQATLDTDQFEVYHDSPFCP
jgi:hypothetical protein